MPYSHSIIVNSNKSFVDPQRQGSYRLTCWSYFDTLVSGSPIIQDGKLVGAVTHVLVNDPTTGYGIFIENMLDAAA